MKTVDKKYILLLLFVLLPAVFSLGDFNYYTDESHDSVLRRMNSTINELENSGYNAERFRDIYNEALLYKNSDTENFFYTAEQRAYNRDLSRKRIKVENVIRELKIFKILSETYRNRRRNHGIKTNIVAGIVNMKVEKRNMKQAS